MAANIRLRLHRFISSLRMIGGEESYRKNKASKIGQAFSSRLPSVFLISLVVGMVPVAGWNLQRRSGVTGSADTPDHAPGRQWFTANCASCHGLDGRGGGRAPDLVASQKAMQISDGRLFRIIEDGIPSAGMPGFRAALEESRVRAIMDYLHVLQGRKTVRAIPGDPLKGRVLFFSKAQCSSCHTIDGEGGFIGPALSQYGQFKSPDEVRKAILEPGKGRDVLKSASLTAGDERTYSGVVRNEDNFSLQLQTMDGAFHLFQKSDLKNVEYRSQSLMPSNYGSTLSKGELDDLVSFLSKVSNTSEGTAAGPLPRNAQPRKTQSANRKQPKSEPAEE